MSPKTLVEKWVATFNSVDADALAEFYFAWSMGHGAWCITVRILCLSCVIFSGLEVLRAQDLQTNSQHEVVLALKPGVSGDGAVTPAWLEGLRYLRRQPDLNAGQFTAMPLSEAEAAWADLIRRNAAIWPGMIDSLRIAFRMITPPDTVTILIGNQGGEDAFMFEDKTICFDVNRLGRVYGSATEAANRERIDRFFAHEFTHVLHKAWRRDNPISLETPLDIALWECLTEGLGNYRSLSAKWLKGRGKLSEHAEAVLGRLQPAFVQRIAALRDAGEADAEALLEGLSMGPFEQKWGALTVALWLAQEAKGDEANLQSWVDAGPAGVLLLAEKYLPDELKSALAPLLIERRVKRAGIFDEQGIE